MTRFFSLVDEHVGRNPVARAIARASLDKALVDFGLELYLCEPGSVQRGNIRSAARVLSVALHLREDDTVRAGLHMLALMEEDGCRWDSHGAGDVDLALAAARDIVTKAPAQDVQRAWAAVTESSA